jgi:protein-S-isoprenylcysteine O-methyltransferase Ste14
MTRASTAIGAIVFFVMAPGLVAGVLPYWLTRWQAAGPLPGRPVPAIIGALLIAVGSASLVESFARFVMRGGGTPAPVAPPRELVVSGQYRLVRNPMYVALLAIIAGQALILGRVILVGYAVAAWALFHLWVVAYEEPNLKGRFGGAYAAYCSHVRRWLPRIRPWSGP